MTDYKNKDGDLTEMSREELAQLFATLDAQIKAAEPTVIGMKQTYEEAAMILADLQYRRGRAAYMLTAKRG